MCHLTEFPEKEILTILRRREGFSRLPYKCPAGHLTVGYGHNLECGISAEAAEFILRQDVEAAVSAVKGAFVWWNKLNDVRRFVLVDMCFNLGISSLKRFKKMLAACAAGDYETAALEMLLSRWALQVGARARENAAMMKSGEWQ